MFSLACFYRRWLGLLSRSQSEPISAVDWIIAIAPIGVLGDWHSKIALGLERRDRGHNVAVVTSNQYRDQSAKLCRQRWA